MKIELSANNTFPSKEYYFWQIVVIPTITILQLMGDSSEDIESYIEFNFEWLFWSVTILIK